MACRCNERRDVMARAAASASRGNLRSIGQAAAFVGKTMAQDAAAIAQQTARRLAALNLMRKR